MDKTRLSSRPFVATRGPVGAGLLALALLAGCGGAAEQDEEAAPPAPSAPAQTDAEETTGSTEPTADATSAPAEQESAAETSAPAAEEATAEAEEATAEEVVITITDFDFDVSGEIAPGAQVTVRNEDEVAHSVTSDEEGLFDIFVGGGEEGTFTVPEEPGEYSFYCKPHPRMVATLVVV